jgi:hypothetical protein
MSAQRIAAVLLEKAPVSDGSLANANRGVCENLASSIRYASLGTKPYCRPEFRRSTGSTSMKSKVLTDKNMYTAKHNVTKTMHALYVKRIQSRVCVA